MPKLLLVEDDPYVLELYKRLFSFKDYKIEEAHNGKECIEMAQKNVPDLILLDIMMPVMDGIEALKELKKHDKTKKVPVVMLTNIDDDISFNAAKNFGAADYLVKSDFTPDQVIEKCEKYLSNSRT